MKRKKIQRQIHRTSNQTRTSLCTYKTWKFVDDLEIQNTQSQQWTSITPIILIQCRSLPHLEPFILENKVMLTRQHKRYRYRSSLWKIRVQILKDVPIHEHSIWMETIQEFACHYHLCIIPATKQKIVQPVRVTKCRVGKRRQSQIFHVRYILES